MKQVMLSNGKHASSTAIRLNIMVVTFLEVPKSSVCDGGEWTKFSDVSCMLQNPAS